MGPVALSVCFLFWMSVFDDPQKIWNHSPNPEESDSTKFYLATPRDTNADQRAILYNTAAPAAGTAGCGYGTVQSRDEMVPEILASVRSFARYNVLFQNKIFVESKFKFLKKIQ